MDNDGAYDTGEPTTTTNGSGVYSFTGLVAGTYHVREVNPSGLTSTGDADGSGNGLDQINVTLTAGQASTGNNFLDTAMNYGHLPVGGTP